MVALYVANILVEQNYDSLIAAYIWVEHNYDILICS